MERGPEPPECGLYSSAVMLCWASNSRGHRDRLGNDCGGGGGHHGCLHCRMALHNRSFRGRMWKAGVMLSGAESRPALAPYARAVRYFGCKSHPGRDGGTGRRSGLKIRRPLRSWGFDPPSRHHNKSIFQNNLHAQLQRFVLPASLQLKQHPGRRIGYLSSEKITFTVVSTSTGWLSSL